MKITIFEYELYKNDIFYIASLFSALILLAVVRFNNTILYLAFFILMEYILFKNTTAVWCIVFFGFFCIMILLRREHFYTLFTPFTYKPPDKKQLIAVSCPAYLCGILKDSKSFRVVANANISLVAEPLWNNRPFIAEAGEFYVFCIASATNRGFGGTAGLINVNPPKKAGIHKNLKGIIQGTIYETEKELVNALINRKIDHLFYTGNRPSSFITNTLEHDGRAYYMVPLTYKTPFFRQVYLYNLPFSEYAYKTIAYNIIMVGDVDDKTKKEIQLKLEKQIEPQGVDA